jgi:hypothetical protein
MEREPSEDAARDDIGGTQLAMGADCGLKLLDPPVVCAGAPAAAELAWIK